jgi:hypothetical protein
MITTVYLILQAGSLSGVKTRLWSLIFYLILQAGKLSGMGMQLTSSQQDPDRACQVACQDHQTLYRFLPTQINPKINKMIFKGKAICCLHKGDEQSITKSFWTA